MTFQRKSLVFMSIAALTLGGVGSALARQQSYFDAACIKGKTYESVYQGKCYSCEEGLGAGNSDSTVWAVQQISWGPWEFSADKTVTDQINSVIDSKTACSNGAALVPNNNCTQDSKVVAPPRANARGYFANNNFQMGVAVQDCKFKHGTLGLPADDQQAYPSSF